jgi:hypothetical protein
MADLVCLQEFGSRMEAVIAREILEARNLPATVFADDGGGVFQGVLFSQGVARLMVHPENVDRARQVLEQLRRPPNEAGGMKGE